MKLISTRRFDQLRLALPLAGFALALRLCMPSPPAATLAGVADMLGTASNTVVNPGEFVWEPSRGVVADVVFGRRVVFLGRADPTAPRDVYRAAVRVSLEGHPISVERAVNLTESPFGDEQGLVGRGEHVAYATVAYGAVQQVTLLDLRGAPQASGDDVLGGLMARLTNIQESGSAQGLGHTEVSANIKAQSARVSLDDNALHVSVDGARSRFGVELETGSLLVGPDFEQSGVSSMQVPPIRKPPIIWAVDTVRAVTGPEPIAWLEEKAFSARDVLKKAGYHTFAGSAQQQEKLRVDGAGPPPPPPPPSRPVGRDGFAQDESWPPQALRTIWEKPDPNEGQWRAPRRPFLQKNKAAAGAEPPPSYFLESFVRPDPERPYSKVLLVAMDSRQVELGMEAGIEDPKPLTGARGEGRIPRDPKILSRVVGAFNGAFKTTHGEYGMMVNRRLLLPPKPGAATVMVMDDGRAGFGTWPESADIPQDMLSFRQNLEPLVEGQQLNPTNRKQWGWHLHGTRMLTHRSGLCVTATGHMVYAWGPEVTGETLGRAMIQAGCVYGIHLDMNPHHTAFAYLDVRNPATRDYDAALLTPEMEVMPDRFILWSPKDFFYLALRDHEPPALEGLQFQPDEGVQPSPAWSPAIWAARAKKDSGGVQVQVVDGARTKFRLGHGDAASALDKADSSHVLASIELLPGEEPNLAKAAPGGRPPQEPVPTPGPSAWVGVRPDGQLELAVASESAPGSEPAGRIALPLLRAGKKSTPLATASGPRQPRAALCRSDDGRVWMARAQAVSYEPLVEVLKRSGCALIVSLDPARGAARFHRTGTPDPAMDRYPHPALYVLARPTEPHAFVWKP